MTLNLEDAEVTTLIADIEGVGEAANGLPFSLMLLKEWLETKTQRPRLPLDMDPT